MKDIAEGLYEGEWLNLCTLMDFVNENLMTNNPKFVVNHFDFKYIDIRIDMRTGHAILYRGSRKMERLEKKDKEIADLKKKCTIGEINEAYAKTIEADKETISKQAVTINKLRQRLEKSTKREPDIYNKTVYRTRKANE